MSDVFFYFLFPHLQVSLAAAESLQIKCKDTFSLISVIQSLPPCLFYLPHKKTEILKKNRILFFRQNHHQNSNRWKTLHNAA